jgi:hypothetical protein
VSKFRLQYGALDIKLERGDFFVGRESTCTLVLDDVLVSRKHAVFRVLGNIVEVEDLRSRNGVLVNGIRIDGPTQLKHGDRINVGTHELLLKDVSTTDQSTRGKDTRSMRTVEFSARCKKCGEPAEFGSTECSNCGETLLWPASSDSDKRSSKKVDDSSARAPRSGISSMLLLTNIADKALSMGRFDEADRILSGILNELLERAKKDRAISAEEFNKAAEYAFLLLEATLKPQWLDYLFLLHGATRRLMPAEVVEGIYRIVNAMRYANSAPIRTYLAELTNTAHAFNPTERFQYNRLQGLERLISSK